MTCTASCLSNAELSLSNEYSQSIQWEDANRQVECTPYSLRWDNYIDFQGQYGVSRKNISNILSMQLKKQS